MAVGTGDQEIVQVYTLSGEMLYKTMNRKLGLVHSTQDLGQQLQLKLLLLLQDFYGWLCNNFSHSGSYERPTALC